MTEVEKTLEELRSLGADARLVGLVEAALRRCDALLRALQDQEAEIDRLRSRVARLEAGLAAMKPQGGAATYN